MNLNTLTCGGHYQILIIGVSLAGMYFLLCFPLSEGLYVTSIADGQIHLLF